ncbi:MAG: DUF2779 domain-containing protein [Bacteroidales bacterium]|nr:DUF2779 domain-containing protein [Bacteroidales bacterium]
MELKYNPMGLADIDAERERREEMIGELMSGASSEDGEGDEEYFDANPSEELQALLPYYNQVEDEALKVAKKYFKGRFMSDSRDVHNQKLYEYSFHGHTYRCYVDIYNENEDEINIIEVKATTSSKYTIHLNSKGKIEGFFFSEKRGGDKYPVFVKNGNIWHLNESQSKISDAAEKNYSEKKSKLLDRYCDEGKYPHDIAFQRFVIEHYLKEHGDNRKVNYYLAVLNNKYIYDGKLDSTGQRDYHQIDDQEVITFFYMNEISKEYQPYILKEIATLESYITTPHDISKPVLVGKWCAWGKNTECIFRPHCYQKLRNVPETNTANKYINSKGAFKEGSISDKYQLINEGYYKFDDIPMAWLAGKDNYLIQRECYDTSEEYIDKDKIKYWLDNIKYPIYHFDFESFPCPLPRFDGEEPYRQSVFEFSLHIERAPGVCDKVKDNVISLNNDCHDDERESLAKAIVDSFEFNEDGSLHGTMLAQNTGFEKKRLEELAKQYPKYRAKLLEIRDKSADLIHLLKTNEELYKKDFGPIKAKTINYYDKNLSGSYSIKKTLPVLVPSLTYHGMDVGNGVQAYIAYLNYDSTTPTFGTLCTKADRMDALKRYCQQDTWAMVEILRSIRKKI